MVVGTRMVDISAQRVVAFLGTRHNLPQVVPHTTPNPVVLSKHVRSRRCGALGKPPLDPPSVHYDAVFPIHHLALVHLTVDGLEAGIRKHLRTKCA
jgi:hypothetical protein